METVMHTCVGCQNRDVPKQRQGTEGSLILLVQASGWPEVCSLPFSKVQVSLSLQVAVSDRRMLFTSHEYINSCAFLRKQKVRTQKAEEEEEGRTRITAHSKSRFPIIINLNILEVKSDLLSFWCHISAILSQVSPWSKYTTFKI